MAYQQVSLSKFFSQINTETKARELLWRYRFGKTGFKCRGCGHNQYHQTGRPEVRQCQSCRVQTRLRAGTIFANSKLPLLTWIRAIYLIMTGKRGMSALELQRHLDMPKYDTVLRMTHKIRRALWQRDERYKLQGLVEFDGASIGKRESKNQGKVLVAVETREFKDETGKLKSKAGFAKICLGTETKKNSEKFIKENIQKGSKLKTDAAMSNLYQKLEGYTVEAKEMLADPVRLNKHLPWVHKFISNAKSWIIGTHHVVKARNLKYYLAEYTYRFNRRHDQQGLFSRALTACCLANPVNASAL